MPLVLLSVNTESPFYNRSVFFPPQSCTRTAFELKYAPLLCCFMSEQFDLFNPQRPDLKKKKQKSSVGCQVKESGSGAFVPSPLSYV